METKFKLKDVAEVIAGYTFRSAIKTDNNGDMFVVQATDTYSNDDIDLQYLPKITSKKGKRSSALLKQNDVVLSCRGDFRASVFIGKSDTSITSSSLFILRIMSKKVSPHFLSVYLNSDIGQNAIKKIATGTIIKTVLRKDLENLSVIIPELERQQQIIDISSNWQKQSKLLIRKTLHTHNIAKGAINYLLTQ